MIVANLGLPPGSGYLDPKCPGGEGNTVAHLPRYMEVSSDHYFQVIVCPGMAVAGGEPPPTRTQTRENEMRLDYGLSLSRPASLTMIHIRSLLNAVEFRLV